MATTLEIIIDMMIGGIAGLFIGAILSYLFMLVYSKYSIKGIKIFGRTIKKGLLENYNPHDDKGRKAEESREFGGRETAVRTATFNPPRQRVVAEQEPLQTASTGTDGKTSISTGKTSKGIRGFFALRRRRKRK